MKSLNYSSMIIFCSVVFGVAFSFTGIMEADAAEFNVYDTTTLRLAVQQANSDEEEDTINVHAGRYMLDDGEGPVKITSDISIIGEDPSTTIIDGNLETGIFVISDSSNSAIQNLEITSGYGDWDNIGDSNYYGGGVKNRGNLILKNCWLKDNVAGRGGGFFNEGDLTVKNCAISGNDVWGSGGGGGYIVGGSVTISDCAFFENSNGGELDSALRIENGTVTIKRSKFFDNLGGDIGRAIGNGGILTMIGCEIINNGGGIRNWGVAIIKKSLIQNNISYDGAGGIANYGEMVVKDSTIAGNHLVLGGGGIRNRGQIKVFNSSITGNWSDHGGGIWSGNYGAPGAKMFLNHCLISENEAWTDGGGIYNNGDELIINQSWIESNIVQYPFDEGVGGIYDIAGTCTIRHTIISSNTPVDCYPEDLCAIDAEFVGKE